MPADSWWKLITPKEIIAGMNQLNGRKIQILDLVSSDMIEIWPLLSCGNWFFIERTIVRLPILKGTQRICLCLLFLLKIIKSWFTFASSDLIEL